MKEKEYCFQCKNSKYVSVKSLNTGRFMSEVLGADVCLKCRHVKRHLSKDTRINGCIHFVPESYKDALKDGV